MRAVLDTCILVDYLNGLEKARNEIEQYSSPSISRITWMEIMCGAIGSSEEGEVRDFLSTFEMVEVDEKIAEASVYVRKSEKLKLPDAIIYATARVLGTILVTRNTRDFDDTKPDIRIPYSV